jgi:hypothetical protein
MNNLHLKLTSEQTLHLEDLRQVLEEALPANDQPETYAAAQYGTCGGTCFIACDSTCWVTCSGHCDTNCTYLCQGSCRGSCQGSCQTIFSLFNP